MPTRRELLALTSRAAVMAATAGIAVPTPANATGSRAWVATWGGGTHDRPARYPHHPA